MPLPIVPLVAALIGVLFALIGRDEIRRTTSTPSMTRGFLVLTVAVFALMAPAVGYFLAFYPDWAWCYLVAGSRVPSAVDLVLVLVACSAAPLAYGWSANALRRHAVRDLVRVVSILGVVAAVVLALLGPRLVVASTYTAFRDGYDLQTVSGTSLGVSIAWVDAWLAAGLAWAALRVRALGRD